MGKLKYKNSEVVKYCNFEGLKNYEELKYCKVL